MLAFVVRRLISLLVTLLLAAAVVFGVLEVLPGDPALLQLGTEAREDTLQALRQEMGLDRPAWERFVLWVGGLMTGDLGTSYTYDVPVGQLIADRLAVTGPLTLLAIALSTLLALPLGLLAAARQNRPADYGVMAFSQIGLAVPGFWFAILLILLFSVELGWFRAGGFPGWAPDPLAALQALVLPALALALAEAAILARVTRSAILETLGEDYVRTARAKGLSPGAVLWGHVLRNALIPVVTIVGLQFAFLMAGTIVIETVFTLPGLGQLLLQAVHQRDLIVVKDVVVLLAGMVVLVNFAVDLLYAAIDPRPRAIAR
ncbi:MAG: ABC transporter permease subunit [Alphaproteobacteria bacterium]|jgi:peptide/nickel transport system permease protein|nr:ABC transporter permease subunit [Alphaproteobacteria bacterium]